MDCARYSAADRAPRCSLPPAGGIGSRPIDAAARSAGRRAHLIVVQRQNQSLLRLLNVLRLSRVAARQSGG